jgi:hypothetical protein
MEASENRGMPPKGSGGGLQRIDPDVVAEILAASDRATGFSRLEMMLMAVLPRLVGETRDPKPS